MIKFKNKHRNNLDELIDLVYKILKDSYNEYNKKEEMRQIQDSLKTRLQNVNSYINTKSLTKIMDDFNKYYNI